MDGAAVGMAADGLSLESVTGPEGSGWVIEIKGHHFYNADPQTWGGTHVRNTFLKNLREQKIALPTGPGQSPTEFTMEELGIQYPIIAVEWKIDQNFRIPNPYYEPEQGGMGSGYDAEGYGAEGYETGMMELGPAGGMLPPAAKPPGGEAGDEEEPEKPAEPPYFAAPKYTFIVQFCWQEIQLTERLRRRQELLQQQQEEGQSPATESGPPPEGVAVTNVGG
jgi:type IV pilus assembly protein PilM